MSSRKKENDCLVRGQYCIIHHVFVAEQIVLQIEYVPLPVGVISVKLAPDQMISMFNMVRFQILYLAISVTFICPLQNKQPFRYPTANLLTWFQVLDSLPEECEYVSHTIEKGANYTMLQTYNWGECSCHILIYYWLHPIYKSYSLHKSNIFQSVCSKTANTGVHSHFILGLQW